MIPSGLHPIVLVASLAIGLLSASARAFGEEDCSVPESLYEFEPTLRKTDKALVDGRDVVIAVLGGSATLGRAAGGASLAWPGQLAAALTRRFPSAQIKVVNLAVARQTAKGAADRLARDVLPLKPTLA
jgi:lysophospholipase L1-like esterase